MKPLAALTVLLWVAVGASAQSYTLGQDDDPTTPAGEPAGWWQRHTYPVEGTVTVQAPAGGSIVSSSCGCNESVRIEEGMIVIDVADAGTHEVTVLLAVPDGRLRVPVAGDATILVPEDHAVVGPDRAVEREGAMATYAAEEGDVFLVAPAAHLPGPTIDTQGGFDWFAAAIGVLGGALIWAFLVRQGMVQRRSRRQVAGEAAHRAQAREDPKFLEARRRTLMAALKDLEKAKIAGEVEAAVYDRLKADLKRQTVTVLRAIEESKASP